MSDTQDTRIAVVGMAGRFPNASNVDALWQALRDGRECLTPLDREELLEAGNLPEDVDHPDYVPMAGLIDGADLFDARLFGFSPREADYIDPQHRIFLEVAMQALEDSGCDPHTFGGAISIYAGAALSVYQVSTILANYKTLSESESLRTLFSIGIAHDYLATRVSYKLGMRGPAVTVQTACSTSLVAIHLACQSLLSGESDVAMAGGVSLQASLFKSGYVFTEGGMTSPDGHCRPFDGDAGGTVFADGAACVVLKRLSDALADGDNIRAVIRGTAVNNDGGEKMGFASPGITGQAAVIAEALAQSDVHPNDVDYIEAHGTGTALGDPIELTALAQAYRATGFSGPPVALGSVKGNVGHLNHASGVTGLIKVILALQNEAIPPNIHFRRLNPSIPADNLPFDVLTRLRPWPRGERPRIAGINSFGIGGTNAHLVIAEAPLPAPSQSSRREWHLLPLSAKTVGARDANAQALREWLRQHRDACLADVAYTLATGRMAFDKGLVVSARSVDEAIAALEARGGAHQVAGTAVHGGDGSRPPSKIAFMFPGQGSQRRGMGADLRRTEPVFEQALVQCLELIKRHAPALDVETAIYALPNDPTAQEGMLDHTEVTQPALFAVSYAMHQLWTSLGVRPDILIGHSIGELVAACVAGVLTLEDAIEVVIHRGRLMGAMERGSMIALPLPSDQVRPMLDDELCLAAENAPELCVVSGPAGAIQTFSQRLKDQGVYGTILRTSHAFHSSMMRPAVAPFVEFLRTKTLRPPEIPIVSNLTGELMTPEMACDPQYWGDQLLNSVYFAKGLRVLQREQVGIALEVGFGKTLSGLSQLSFDRQAAIEVVTSLPPSEGGDEGAGFARAMGRMWVAGGKVQWAARYAGEQRRKLVLPGYQFERSRYWAIENTGARARLVDNWTHALSWRRRPEHPLLSARPSQAPSWLVFSNGSAFSRATLQALRDSGAAVSVVEPGGEYIDYGAGVILLDPSEPLHFEALFKTLHRLKNPPDHLLYLWGTPGAQLGIAGRSPLEMTYFGLLRMVQALAAVWDPKRDMRMNLVSFDAHAVVGTEPIDPDAATVGSLALTIGLEHGNLPCRHLDLSSQEAEADAADLARRMLGAFHTDDLGTTAALRNGAAWTPFSEPVRLPDPKTSPDALRQHGVYMITGGLGDIGLAIAGHLAKSYQARLILVSRQQLPPCEQWDACSTSPETPARLAKTLHALLALQSSGAQVHVASVDVGDAAAFDDAARVAIERFGPVHGVFHAAGLPGVKPLVLKTMEQAGRVLDVKLAGARNVERFFAGAGLDFVALFSSVASLTGGLGQADYGPANACLDAMARRGMPACTQRVVTFNWDAWGQLGMAVNTAMPEPAASAWAAEVRKIGLSTQHGWEILSRGLRSGLSQIVVSKRLEIGFNGHPEGFVRFSKALPRASDAHLDEPVQAAVACHPRPPMSVDYLAPRNDLEKVLVDYWADALSIDGIGVNDDFYELGGHSLLALQLMPRLRKHFGVTLSPQEYFGAGSSTTIATLGRAIEAKLIEEIKDELAQEAQALPGPASAELAEAGSGLVSHS